MGTKPQPAPSTTAEPLKPWVFRVAALLALFFAVAAVLLGIQHFVNQGRKLREAKTEARQIAIKQAEIIGQRLKKLTPVAERIAADLSSGALKPEDASDRLKRALEENPDLFAAGIAYLPYAWNPRVRLFAPNAAWNGANIDQFQVEQRYDYTTYDWFKDGIAAASPHWGEPYLGGATKTLVVGYSVPFYRQNDPGPNRTPIGLVRTNLSLNGIHQIVSSLALGETGYAFLLSRKGVYLSDPVADYMRDLRTIFDVAQERIEEGEHRLRHAAGHGVVGDAPRAFRVMKI